jgi:hypothetical protein
LKYAGENDADVPLEGIAAPSNGHNPVKAMAGALAVPDDAIVVPDAHLLFHGDFKRAGVDLVLSGDGREIVLHDYFKGAYRAPIAI